MPQVQSKVVIRYLDCDGTYTYMGAPWEDSYGDQRFGSEYTFEDAFDLSESSNGEVMDFLEKYQDENEGFDCELVKITISTEIEDLMEDDPEFKELRQRAALKKLTEAEIKALGITNIAVYIKTKYHNV
jgi:hypothetical protein